LGFSRASSSLKPRSSPPIAADDDDDVDEDEEEEEEESESESEEETTGRDCLLCF
jgi:hypothetical protein